MANTITAGNGTNNGLAVTSDATGALNILTGSGAGTAAISIDSSQNVTASANLSVTGNATITGTLSATNGITGSLKSATAQSSTSGTSIDFTSIPSGVKRITVMLNGVSLSGSSNILVQIGAGSVTTTGYNGATTLTGKAIATDGSQFSSGVQIYGNGLGNLTSGSIIFTLISGNIWVISGSYALSNAIYSGVIGGNITLSGTLDRLRITTVNGTDTFDAGSINIIYE